jgi:hypothetical protein
MQLNWKKIVWTLVAASCGYLFSTATVEFDGIRNGMWQRLPLTPVEAGANARFAAAANQLFNRHAARMKTLIDIVRGLPDTKDTIVPTLTLVDKGAKECLSDTAEASGFPAPDRGPLAGAQRQILSALRAEAALTSSVVRTLELRRTSPHAVDRELPSVAAQAELTEAEVLTAEKEEAAQAEDLDQWIKRLGQEQDDSTNALEEKALGAILIAVVGAAALIVSHIRERRRTRAPERSSEVVITDL